VTNCDEYGPFGEVIRQTGPMAKVKPFRFSTKYQDDESDLLYYGYRYYKASSGTWVNKDPLGEIGFTVLINSQFQKLLTGKITRLNSKNIYSFLDNKPISYSDVFCLNQYPSNPCNPGQKYVEERDIRHMKGTIGISLTDFFPGGEAPKSKLGEFFAHLKEYYEQGKILRELIGDEISDDPYWGCVSDCAQSSPSTTFGLEDIDMEPDTPHSFEIIIYYYIETDYNWYCPCLIPCITCFQNAPVTIPPITLVPPVLEPPFIIF